MKCEIKYKCPWSCSDELEKTIVWLLASHKRCSRFRFDEQDYNELADFLLLDKEKIKMILQANDDRDECIDEIEFSDGSNGEIKHYEIYLFQSLFFLLKSFSMIKKINPDKIEKSLYGELNEINAFLLFSY